MHIQVWPPEQFEMGAEFMESLALCFRNAHGFKMKSVFAENLTHLLHPLGKVRECSPYYMVGINLMFQECIRRVLHSFLGSSR